MTPRPDHHHYVRRVVLPSGKTIEVVYFEDRVAADPRGAEGPDPLAPTHGELHVCTSCRSELVHPVEWEEAGAHHWEVTLRCPNCEWSGTGVFAQEVVERFDEVLDAGTEAVVRDLKRLMHANMEDEIERFTAALEAGYVRPEDF